MGFSSVDSFIITFSTRSGGIAARRCFMLGPPGLVISPWLVVTSSMINSTIWDKPTCSTYCHVQDEMELVAKKNIGHLTFFIWLLLIY